MNIKRGFILLFCLLVLANYSFATTNHPPTIVLAQPTAYSIVHNNTVNFLWDFYDMDNDTQQGFRIQISTDFNFYTLIKDFIGYGSNTNLEFNLPDSTYYWRVQGYDGKDWGVFSDPNTFTLNSQKQYCNDGTEYWQCNSQLQYCYGGSLISNCKFCGCAEGYTCNIGNGLDSKCIPKTCEDGTVYGQCNNYYKLCNEGALTDDCSKCGCPQGKVCSQEGKCKEPQPIVTVPAQPQQSQSWFDSLTNFIKLLFSF